MKEMLLKGRTAKRLFSVALALIMALTLIPMMTVHAEGNPIAYIDANGQTKQVSDYTVIDGTQTVFNDGWYVVNNDVKMEYLDIEGGSVNIILVDGKTLTLESGMYVISGSLAVYGQSGNTGTINAECTDKEHVSFAVEGEGFINVNGGTINAKECLIVHPDSKMIVNGGTINASTTNDEVSGFYINGIVTINGGTINATESLAIDYYEDIIGELIVNGGTINASATNSEASGLINDGKMTINNGTVNAKSSDAEKDVAGIIARGDTIINGGTINATSPNGWGIWAGVEESIITIKGGIIEAVGGEEALYTEGVMTINGSPVIKAGDSKGTATDKNDGKEWTAETLDSQKYIMISYDGKDDTEVAFTDVKKGAYYYDAVAWAAKNDITTGKDSTHFDPDGDCERGQVVTFLWRAAGKPEPKKMSSFTDVSANAYYAKAVAWAAENEITTGTSPTTFNPTGTCTREQFVTFLWRAANKPESKGQNKFSDVAAGKYYTDAVTWAAENKITTGVSPTKFDTGKNCLRGQVVTFMYRYYK